ncbi:hypothetical protein TWF281_007089 [Arthrobotrys megalospora]
MLNPDIDWNIPIEEYQLALNAIPRDIRLQNPAWRWQPDANIQMGWMDEELLQPPYIRGPNAIYPNGPRVQNVDPWAAADALAKTLSNGVPLYGANDKRGKGKGVWQSYGFKHWYGPRHGKGGGMGGGMGGGIFGKRETTARNIKIEGST